MSFVSVLCAAFSIFLQVNLLRLFDTLSILKFQVNLAFILIVSEYWVFSHLKV